MDFFRPSEKATARPKSPTERKYNFPFEAVPIGMSFSVGKNEVINVETLRTLASRYGKRLERIFKVVEHEECYEVFYRARRPPKPLDEPLGEPIVGKPAKPGKQNPANANPPAEKPAPISVGKNEGMYDENGDLVGRWKGYA